MVDPHLNHRAQHAILISSDQVKGFADAVQWQEMRDQGLDIHHVSLYQSNGARIGMLPLMKLD